MSEPAKIRLETPHYLLRTIALADASDAWAQWLTHPDTARMLNAQARAASVEDIRTYIRSFDGHNRHLLGIFQKDGGALVGIRDLRIDWQRREFLVNVLVGEVAARGKGAREETREVLYRHFFEALGLQTARCTVLAHNAPILRVMDKGGWELTDTNYKAAAGGGAPLEIRSYRLSRETWARKAREKAARDGA
ncbi:MAG: GNAT family N-acetyltransferase [Alphaproteobacteria bacterium]|nr:GNAT family N-acetyltransferase [Alphaproteobacteria bacterium]